ncbi:MAG TPA: branched-chain amino acid ABC transporter ATP-binding protein/permease [Candidatus Baltobacteraceae bacterium]|nr:branched-chain amino acid ABC transporter ATP-binding protein/permease [Candidatus Baltobacteraceae bacterium]
MTPRNVKPLLGIGLALVVIAFPMLVQSSYWLNLVNLAISFSVACLGLNIVLGYAGQLSLAQASFWGVGAYTSALLTVNYHLPVWLGLPAAFLVAALFGIMLGIPTLKLTGHYLAMATIGFGIILQLILINAIWLTGGSDGIPKIPSPWIGSLELKDPSKFFFVAAIMLILMTWASMRIKDSRVGRAFFAIQGNEMAAETTGVDSTYYKVMAFALSAGYGGVGGWLFAHSGSHYISPDTFSFDQSVMFLAMAVLGGNGSAIGSIVGATLLTLVPEILRFLKDYYMMVYAAGIVIVMIFMPGGIAGLVRTFNISQKLQTWWQASSRAVVQAAHEAGTPAANLLPPVAAAPHGDGTLLTVRGLAKHFGGLKAVDGVDMAVRRGEIQALIGPNGSGKTTIINMLSGLYVPSAGDILLDGGNITGRKPHVITTHGVARTFQNIRLFGELTALDNVMIGQHSRTRTGLFGSVLQGGSQRAEEAAMREKALKVLDFVGLRGQEFAQAKSLPYGRQRVLELARALVSEPKLLLLDEPAAGLNATETEALLDLLFQVRDHGITILLVEHDMSLVMNVSDHITVLNFGKKIAEGNAEAIQKNQEVIDAYLGTEVGNA